ncbi:hypothetical protein [Microbacterium sp.]|uniref:cation transporter dimerization domain-containing protein n=1 Tax=Microbacterium sp. TaxID=51671 RepID=UPI002810D92A|nr:hypothetical protein [Microbacterium sp.]
MSASGDSNQTPSASEDDYGLIVDAIIGCDGVQKIIQLRTLQLDSDDLLIAAKVALVDDVTVRAAADQIDVIKTRIRAAVPAASSIYIEPDVYRPGIDPAPPTDVFVLKSAD